MVPKLPMRPVLRAGGCLALVTCRVFDYLRAGLLRSNIATPARISPIATITIVLEHAPPSQFSSSYWYLDNPGIRLVSIIVKRSIDLSRYRSRSAISFLTRLLRNARGDRIKEGGEGRGREGGQCENGVKSQGR